MRFYYDIPSLWILGNPGVIEFYRDFMGAMYKELNEWFTDIPVWGVAHAGHQADGVDSTAFPSITGRLAWIIKWRNEWSGIELQRDGTWLIYCIPIMYKIDFPELYDLEGQIQHKESFLKKFIPQHVKVVIVAHSIGCKISMEVLKRNPDLRSRTLKTFLLFPTIERMRVTPNGQRLWKFSSVPWLISYLIWPFSLLPISLQRTLIGLYLRNQKAPDCVKKAALQLFNPQVFQRFVSMGFSELRQVWELDVEGILELQDSLYFYFGRTDGWCPLEFVEEMKVRLPHIHHSICDQGLDHAFVISNSLEMASILTPMITQLIS